MNLISSLFFGLAIFLFIISAKNQFFNKQTFLNKRIRGKRYDKDNINDLDLLLESENKKLSFKEKIDREILRSGLKIQAEQYFLFMAISVLVIFTFSLTIFHGTVGIALPLSISGFYIPKLYLKMQYNARLKKISSQLIDTIQAISSSVSSGYSIEKAIENIAENAPYPTNEEFGYILKEINYGKTLEEALEGFRKRIDDSDVDLLVTVLLIQRETGGKLTYALNNIVDTIKSRVELKRHIKAITAQGKFTAILLGVIPLCMFFLLNLVSKGYFDNMFNTGIGRIMIILALILDGFGTFVTFKIASPKIKNF